MDDADPSTAIFRKIIAQPPWLTNSACTCLLFNKGGGCISCWSRNVQIRHCQIGPTLGTRSTLVAPNSAGLHPAIRHIKKKVGVIGNASLAVCPFQQSRTFGSCLPGYFPMKDCKIVFCLRAFCNLSFRFRTMPTCVSAPTPALHHHKLNTAGRPCRAISPICLHAVASSHHGFVRFSAPPFHHTTEMPMLFLL
jgi:hypothetical protein